MFFKYATRLVIHHVKDKLNHRVLDDDTEDAFGNTVCSKMFTYEATEEYAGFHARRVKQRTNCLRCLGSVSP